MSIIIEEAENIRCVNDTRDAVRKIQLKILSFIRKCPFKTRELFVISGNEIQTTITILEDEKRVKPSGGGRGSREKRRRRRQQERIQEQSQQHEQQQPLQQRWQQSEPAQFSSIDTVERRDLHSVPEFAAYTLAAVEQNSSPGFQTFHQGGLDQRQSHQAAAVSLPVSSTRPQVRQESNNSTHLMSLVLHKMNEMNEDIMTMKSDRCDLMKEMEQLRCTVKRIKEAKEKAVFCFHCSAYVQPVHFCP